MSEVPSPLEELINDVRALVELTRGTQLEERTAIARDNVLASLAIYDYAAEAAPKVEKTAREVWADHARLRLAAADVINAWRRTQGGEESVPEHMFRALRNELNSLEKPS